MNNKPSFEDFKKSNIYEPIVSGGYEYKLGSARIVFFSYFFIFALMYFLMQLNPFYRFHLFWWLFITANIILMGVSLSLFRFSIYHIGWFYVTPSNEADQAKALTECDDEQAEIEQWNALHRVKRKSFLKFTTLIAAFLIIGVLLRHLTFGLAHQRLYNNHKQELDQLIQIAQKYENIYTGDIAPVPQHIAGSLYKNVSASPLPEAEAATIRTICVSLNGHYIDNINGGKDKLNIWMSGGISLKRLTWYPDEMTAEEVSTSIYDKKVIQLDDHWWCVW